MKERLQFSRIYLYYIVAARPNCKIIAQWQAVIILG